MAERERRQRKEAASEVATEPSAPSLRIGGDVYSRLAAPFDQTFRDVRGGVELEYVTGEQVCSRLNEVLGVAGWSFRLLEHGINVEADEVWALGELTAEVDGRTVVRQQFGSQKLKRSRSSGVPLDIGFDLKGAGTDALKKCASLIGVGLYLSRKESLETRGVGADSNVRDVRAAGRGPAVESSACEDCGNELRETRFKDGTVWAPAQLAGYGRRKHGKVLCMDCYRAANESRKAAVLGQLSA